VHCWAAIAPVSDRPAKTHSSAPVSGSAGACAFRDARRDVCGTGVPVVSPPNAAFGGGKITLACRRLIVVDGEKERGPDGSGDIPVWPFTRGSCGPEGRPTPLHTCPRYAKYRSPFELSIRRRDLMRVTRR
jgi:hypothetical protein